MFLGINDFELELQAGITAGATTMSVLSADGAALRAMIYPSHSTTEERAFVPLVFGTWPSAEVVYAVGVDVADTTVTILRGQEGTTASSWSSGDTCKCVLTQGAHNYQTRFGMQNLHLHRDDTVSGTYNIDLALAPMFYYTVTGAVTFSFSNIREDLGAITSMQKASLWLKSDGGTRSIAWNNPNNIYWDDDRGELDSIYDTSYSVTDAVFRVEFEFYSATEMLAKWHLHSTNYYSP